jgi:hypothetical protein
MRRKSPAIKDDMAKRCASREEATIVANRFLADFQSPAVVEIVTETGEKQFWAVQDDHDLDTVPGYVESLEILR